MQLYTTRSVVVFVIIVTVGVLLAAEVLNFAIFPDEVLSYTVPGTALIVLITTIPTCIFIGMNIRENTMLSAELRRLVERDRLTDASTRDYFFAQLAKAPDGYGVSLMVDIDNFKNVNDTYGHLAGDTVIQLVARVLGENVRLDDIVCRFGGEEFVIFLKEASKLEGWEISERIRKGIEAAGTPSAQGVIKVTVSVGGSLKESMEEIEAAIARADACLYKAKARGRNQTVVDWRYDTAANTAA